MQIVTPGPLMYVALIIAGIPLFLLVKRMVGVKFDAPWKAYLLTGIITVLILVVVLYAFLFYLSSSLGEE